MSQREYARRLAETQIAVFSLSASTSPRVSECHTGHMYSLPYDTAVCRKSFKKHDFDFTNQVQCACHKVFQVRKNNP